MAKRSVQECKVIRTFPPGGRLLRVCLNSEHLLLKPWQNERLGVLILCVLLLCSTVAGPAPAFSPSV